ncbi:MAG: Ditrans,polycis-undecaprenyl-diphosphate synthase ((2E,6E)-farnesyl-diphosphate specific) [Chlamydiae bacterium]|nr:Ditrans,polycis-undecaprenyl-diphosphate synthase ((2E,6E)-farnesyl-diphosphate specific) [Chlamydiota bacterium]
MNNLAEKPLYSEEDFASIDPKLIPEHIAIAMDGNRRWARKYGKSVESGHWQGAEQLDAIVRASADLGVKTLTVYSFSTENWKRSRREVELLMQLLEAYLINKREVLVKEGVRLHTIGDISRLPDSLQRQLEESKRATKSCDRIDLVLALNYGGRDEVRRAFLKMSHAAEAGELDWESVTEATISSYLDTAQWPDPELYIRPSGVQRLSNFLIWQISYTEIVVMDTLWPDFSPKDLLEAVIEYQRRQRRFGG